MHSGRSMRLAIIGVGFILFAFGPGFYWKLLQQHGTFAPFFAWWYTTVGPEMNNNIPADWKPASRVVVSLSTMPRDVVNLGEVLGSITAQMLQPDTIYVNLPERCKRNGEEYVIPDWLKTYPKVKINRPKTDYGPLTKIFPAIEAETDPNAIIISLDDDKIYSPHVLRHLVWYAEQDADAAWGMCGWALGWAPLPLGVVSVYVPWFMRTTHARGIDILQGVCGVAYRRKFFPDLDKLSKPHDNCFLSDDMWMGSYLALISNHKRYLTPGPVTAHWSLEPTDTNWLRTKRVERLSDTNRVVDKDYSCVRGVTEKLGDWASVTVARLEK